MVQIIAQSDELKQLPESLSNETLEFLEAMLKQEGNDDKKEMSKMQGRFSTDFKSSAALQKMPSRNEKSQNRSCYKNIG